MEILDEIPIKISLSEVKKRLRMGDDQPGGEVQELIDRAAALVRPRALYQVHYIEGKSEDAVEIGGLRFRSRVLRKNLDQVQRVFPYVLTIGSGIQESTDSGDMLTQYMLDTIANVALTGVRRFLARHLTERFGLEKISYMSPGSLADWPIEQQRSLFALLGDVRGSLGVSLSDSCLMLPAKSLSGIYFASQVSFYSCQLCPRRDCPGRKAAHDPQMAKEYGVL